MNSRRGGLAGLAAALAAGAAVAAVLGAGQSPAQAVVQPRPAEKAWALIPDEGGIDAAQKHVERVADCMRTKGYKVERSAGGGHHYSGPPGPIETMYNDRLACVSELGVSQGEPGSPSRAEQERAAGTAD